MLIKYLVGDCSLVFYDFINSLRVWSSVLKIFPILEGSWLTVGSSSVELVFGKEYLFEVWWVRLNPFATEPWENLELGYEELLKKGG